MTTPAFLRGLIELATCETVDALVDHAVALVERELGVRASIELFDRDDLDLSHGFAPSEAARTAPYRTWIGTRYTVGGIYLSDAPPTSRASSCSRASSRHSPSASSSAKHRSDERFARTSIASTSAAFATPCSVTTGTRARSPASWA